MTTTTRNLVPSRPARTIRSTSAFAIWFCTGPLSWVLEMKNWFSAILVSERRYRIDCYPRTDVDEVLRFANELDVCSKVR